MVILIPGAFARHLKAGSQRIWIDLKSLAAGKLDRLALDKAGGKRQAAVKPDGIVEDSYVDLIHALSARFQVMPFAHDWRKSLSSEVKDLAATVEKAMGGNRKRRGRPNAHVLRGWVGGFYGGRCKEGGREHPALPGFQRGRWFRDC